MNLRNYLSAAASGLALTLAAPVFAHEVDETPEVEEVAEKPAGPALWKVADEDTTIYLFGTVHALPEGVDWYNVTIKEALASSDSIVTEITMDDSMATKMQELVIEKGVYPAGTTLRSKLTEEQRPKFEEGMTKLGLPVAAFDQFEPWYAAMMMSILPLLQQGYTPESGVEMVLLKNADGIQRGALETIDYQIAVFDSMPEETQIRFLLDTAENVDQIKPMLDAMLVEWLEGDADSLADLMNEGLDDPVVAERLLYIRNRNWAEWIETRLDAPGTLFIAVGAGHLAGDQSVQDMLGELGVETTRVQ
ncbi:TraB/GumN family protein [Altererythrobacter sp. MF3-039]|uniref:TraB/GumN family protein n=1 Tax=Altererythrobacter sp. MF3-039 TaxID=3252901 RepID=UPI00390CB72E